MRLCWKRKNTPNCSQRPQVNQNEKCHRENSAKSFSSFFIVKSTKTVEFWKLLSRVSIGACWDFFCRHYCTNLFCIIQSIESKEKIFENAERTKAATRWILIEPRHQQPRQRVCRIRQRQVQLQELQQWGQHPRSLLQRWPWTWVLSPQWTRRLSVASEQQSGIPRLSGTQVKCVWSVEITSVSHEKMWTEEFEK